MHITCEHCGSTINVDKDRVCPGCKAPYNDNKMYKELLLEQERKRQIDLESKNIDLEIKKNFNDEFKGSKKGNKVIKIFAIVIFIFAITGIICSIISSIKFDKEMEEDKNNNFNEIFDENNELISVNLNEDADTGKYKIKCDEVLTNELYDNFYKDKKINPEDGYKYITVHILLNNYKDDDYYFISEVNLLTNGIANENIYDWNRKEIEMLVPANMTKSGYYTFKVKEEEKNYIIRIGNKVEIKINEDELK